jgi:hypothetical protein
MSFQGRGSNRLGKIHALLPSLNGNKVVILVWRVIIHIADISTSGKWAPPLFHGVWGNFHSCFMVCEEIFTAFQFVWAHCTIPDPVGSKLKKNYIHGRWCQCFSPVPSVWKTHIKLHWLGKFILSKRRTLSGARTTNYNRPVKACFLLQIIYIAKLWDPMYE